MNIQKIVEELRSVGDPEVLYDTCELGGRYDEIRQIFNLRFDFKPAAIVLCESAEEISNAIRVAKAYNYQLRVCAGRHDHEGECSADGVILVDVRKMKKLEVDTARSIAKIGAGYTFQELIPALQPYGVSLPHGTCESVGLAGFTFGGGWGPWTRAKGMCCESLVGATIVLGDGEIRKLRDDSTDEADQALLWALRGGGGFSYGIVTELVIETFPLPEDDVKFNVEWYTSPGIEVLRLWEGLIASDANPKLVGTNLQMNAKPLDDQSIEKSVHHCIFYGYYAGTQEDLVKEMDVWFKDLRPDRINLPEHKEHNDAISFSTWDGMSKRSKQREKLLLAGKEIHDFPPDKDFLAPHRISSRLVRSEGLGEKGRRNLIKSLRSDLIYPDGEAAGVYAYVTLGAISGAYYRDYNLLPNSIGSAFPYKDRPFIVQYQVWWNIQDHDANHQAVAAALHAQRYANEAFDWIDVSRERDFPQTRGSFISFKDSSVPTRNYFLESYERLRYIKLRFSKDENNLFHSRKTIV